MALVNYVMRTSDRFSCEQPSDAAPWQKRANVVSAAHDVRHPCCIVEMEVGTRGTLVERVNANHYQGHVPDAPIMLNAQRTADYTRAAHETKLISPRRACALGACLVVGSFGAVGATGVVWLASLALHALLPGTVPVLTAYAAKLTWAGLASIAMGVLIGSENVAWQVAHERFATLAALGQAHGRGGHQGSAKMFQHKDRTLMQASLESTDFAIQQAASELMGAGCLSDSKSEKAA